MLKHNTNNSNDNNNYNISNNAEKVFEPASRLGNYLGGSVDEENWVAGTGAGLRANEASQPQAGDSCNLENEELQKVHPHEEERINQKRVSVQRALKNLDDLLNELRPNMDHPKEALDESRDDLPAKHGSVEQSLHEVSALMEHLVSQAELNQDDTDPSQCLDQSRKTSTASVASSNSSASSLSSLIEDRRSRESSAEPDNFSEASTRKASHAESVLEAEDQVDSLTKQLTECLETKEVVNWSRDIKSTTIFGKSSFVVTG